jgi:hypothetical protein
VGGWCAAHPPTARLRMAGRALYRPGATLRTGLTHFFERRASADRSAVGRFWAECSSGAFGEPTPGVCPGFVQTNMVCVQKEHAYDFLQFCLRNPQPCPLLDVSEVALPMPQAPAPPPPQWLLPPPLLLLLLLLLLLPPPLLLLPWALPLSLGLCHAANYQRQICATRCQSTACGVTERWSSSVRLSKMCGRRPATWCASCSVRHRHCADGAGSEGSPL